MQLDHAAATSRPEVVGPPRKRFVSQEWYERELAAIFRPAWHVVAHVSELPEPGSFVTFSLGAEEIVVVRDSNGELQGYHNFCRHRGHRLCAEPQGRVGDVFVCPYHAWTFATSDGALRGSARMHEGFDPSQWGLVRAWVEEWGGFVFACVAEERPDSLAAALDLEGSGGYDLGRMRLAARRTYEIAANWKVVGENNTECYHCAFNHPELCTIVDPWEVNYVGSLDEDDTFATMIQADVGSRPIPDAAFSVDNVSVSRLAAPRTDDGPPHGYEVYWQPCNLLTLARDYTWLFTLTPLGVDRTLSTQYWLVHEDAREGVDYDLDEVMSFWVTTMDQDAALCEEVWRGILNPRYTPGPLNRHYQAGQMGFYDWYESRLAAWQERGGTVDG